jgi:hypothetical protein
MKRIASLLFIGVCALFLQGLASGAEAETKGNIPFHATGKARINFYRTATVSPDVQPVVRLDGVNMGTAQPKVWFYMDTTPEEHVVTIENSPVAPLKFKVALGGTQYVRLNVVEGRIVPELVEMAVGDKEMLACTLAKAK